jgi:hypothetical protein
MTTAAVRVQADDGGVRDDDAVARPTRRRFSAVYKLSILDEYEFRVRRDAQMAVGVVTTTASWRACAASTPRGSA